MQGMMGSSRVSQTELLDEFLAKGDSPDIPTAEQCTIDDESIGFTNANFSWSQNVSDGTATSSGRDFQLQLEGEVRFERGALNMVVGPTGSGKTSLLMALLGSSSISSPDVHIEFM